MFLNCETLQKAKPTQSMTPLTKTQKGRGMINITGWGVFWLCVIVYMCLDTYLFTLGYETGLWKHRTPEEKQIQQIKIEAMRNGKL